LNVDIVIVAADFASELTRAHVKSRSPATKLRSFYAHQRASNTTSEAAAKPQEATSKTHHHHRHHPPTTHTTTAHHRTPLRAGIPHQDVAATTHRCRHRPRGPPNDHHDPPLGLEEVGEDRGRQNRHLRSGAEPGDRVRSRAGFLASVSPDTRVWAFGDTPPSVRRPVRGVDRAVGDDPVGRSCRRYRAGEGGRGHQSPTRTRGEDGAAVRGEACARRGADRRGGVGGERVSRSPPVHHLRQGRAAVRGRWEPGREALPERSVVQLVAVHLRAQLLRREVGVALLFFLRTVCPCALDPASRCPPRELLAAACARLLRLGLAWDGTSCFAIVFSLYSNKSTLPHTYLIDCLMPA
jgi:hypothetical protein